MQCTWYCCRTFVHQNVFRSSKNCPSSNKESCLFLWWLCGAVQKLQELCKLKFSWTRFWFRVALFCYLPWKGSLQWNRGDFEKIGCTRKSPKTFKDQIVTALDLYSFAKTTIQNMTFFLRKQGRICSGGGIFSGQTCKSKNNSMNSKATLFQTCIISMHIRSQSLLLLFD